MIEDPRPEHSGQLVSGVWYIGETAYATAKLRMPKRSHETIPRLIVRHVIIDGPQEGCLKRAKQLVLDRRREIESGERR